MKALQIFIVFGHLLFLLDSIKFLLYGNKADMNFPVGCVLLLGIMFLAGDICNRIKSILND